MLNVAFAGEPGSFAEDAVLAAYPGATAVPVPLFDDVVNAVVTADVAAGVLPIEALHKSPVTSVVAAAACIAGVSFSWMPGAAAWPV